ncbi:unnamed protein product [Calypogeia fissa]
MWEGWAQTSPTLTEQLQHQLGGSSTKSGSSYQHDLLSSWLMSGYQTVGLHHNQHQHGGEEGSGTTVTMYQDEFSRMTICPSTSSDCHGVSSPSAAAAGVSDASHQLYHDVIQTCSSSVPTGPPHSGGPTEFGQSAKFLSSPTLDHNMQEATHKLDVNPSQKTMHQTSATTGLSSRGSSSSPPSGLNTYGKTMQLHLGVQFDSNSYWASTGSTSAAITTSSRQPSDCVGGGGVCSSSRQEEPNTSCDSIILHHHHQQQQQQSSKKGSCDGNDTLFHNSGTDLTSDQMYAELHGLLSKNMETPAHGGAIDHDHHQLAICGGGASPASGNYGDHSSWTQFTTVSPSFCTPSSHGEGFTSIQEVVDQTMFSSSTPDSLSTATYGTRKDDTSPSSAGTAMSAIHNFNAAAAGAAASDHHTHAAALPYRSSSVDLDSPEMGLQRKRPLSRENEQVGESGISAEDSVKRSCIVRCLWEQNIAQLQLANLPSEHQRNLWQLQSQALFGRLPANFLIGGSDLSNSGSVLDMNTAVGPALNTNGRPRARRGSATDPQSVYARHRRERINDRLKVLQHLVPNGAKVDIVTMLEEAINYVKFLQLQIKLLSSDELWIYAPTTYNGVDVSMGVHAGLLNQQA